MSKIPVSKILISVAGSVDTDTGQRTTTLVEQLSSKSDIEIVGVFNSDINEAKKVIDQSGLKNSGKLAHTNLDSFLNQKTDIVIISEMDSANAHRVIMAALSRRINVINLNAITECALGYLYKETAQKNQVIYTVGAGDEPAVTLDLVHYCQKLNLKVICAGKGKNNPMDTKANENDFIELGKQKNVNPRSLASFVDGTKTMLEMAILSNSTGWPIDCPGMHGPAVNVDELAKTFIPKSDGGILANYPVIDFGIGNVAPGVFVVFTTDQTSIIDELIYLKMKGTKYFVLYKPYHLGNIEAPLSIYDIIDNHRATICIKHKFVTMVCAKAKKDMRAGELIDTAGGFAFFGFALSAEESEKNNYAPLALVEKSTLKQDIKKGDFFTFNHLEMDSKRGLEAAWNLQSKMLMEEK